VRLAQFLQNKDREQMRDKAHEIAEEFRAEGSNAIKNV